MKLLTGLLLIPLLSAQEPQKLEKICTQEDEDTFGLTCSQEEPCPVFLELTSAISAGSAIFVTGDLHTLNTTMFGLLLESEDGGVLWTEPSKRLPAADLEEIQFVDPQHGWISGVKLEPLPRDPFMLSTTDGGKTWSQNPLFDDAVFGSIQQFWFESPTNGELILDRSQGATKHYDRYATMTAGSSWELEETDSKPIRLSKSKPKESAGWRVRADGQTYRVERQAADGTWQGIAVFPIHVGDCQ